MIRTRETGDVIPREQPDSRGLSEALARADDGEAAEAELQRQNALQRADQELHTVKATRALFVDALYRAKALNGDAAFDLDDVDDLDAIEGMAERIAARRRKRGANS